MVAESSSQFNIHDAKTNLSRIIDRVEHGEEIIISRAGTPVAKVVPLVRAVSLLAAGRLPLIHRDPFGRMLVAQAQCEDLTLVTRDENCRKYGVTVLVA